MKIELIISKKIRRTQFQNEFYSGEDNIFALVEKGSFISRSSGEFEEVEAYDGYCFSKGVSYERHVKEELSVFLFRFKSDENVFPSGKITFKDKERIRSTLSLLNNVRHNPSFDEYESNEVLLYELFLQYRSENADYRITKTEDAIVGAAKEYMDEHLREKLDFENLASEYGISYVQFFRRFKKETGMPPSEYLFSRRMKRASYLLESTKLPVKKISEECGFSDEYYFSNFFKKYYHISPTAYRKSIL